MFETNSFHELLYSQNIYQNGVQKNIMAFSMAQNTINNNFGISEHLELFDIKFCWKT